MRNRCLFAVLLLAGCDPHALYKVSSVDNQGVPFFRRIAVHKETVQIQQAWVRLDVTLLSKVSVPDKEKGKTAWVDSVQTATVFFGGADANGVVAQQISLLEASTADYETALKAFREVSKVGLQTPPPHVPMLALWDDLVKFKTKPNGASEPIGASILADVCAVDRVASADEQFVNIDVPRGGSANADIKLGADGTLAEGTGGIQDQLPATIATGLGALITAAGTLGGVALTANAAIATAKLAVPGVTTTQNAMDFVAEPPEQEPKNHGPVLVGLSATVTPGRVLHTLGLQWPFEQFRHRAAVELKTREVSPISLTLANMCDSPCFASDHATLDEHECLLTYFTADEAAQVPADKKKTKDDDKKGAEKTGGGDSKLR